jgi:hypothetical protein
MCSTQACAPYTQTHSSLCKVVLPARAFARCCAPVAPILLFPRLRGWREHRHSSSMVRIIIINCLWFFCRKPTRVAIAPISHQRDSIPIHHPTQLQCAPHKLVRPPDPQPRQHHTHSSLCKVVLRARASARRCAPVASMLFRKRLRGWREQRDRNSMITVITIDCVWLFSRRPARLAPISHQHVSISIHHVLHTSLCARWTLSPDSITLTTAPARSCCSPEPLLDAAPRQRRSCCRQGCAGGVSSEIEFPWPHPSQSIVFGSFLGDRPGLPSLVPISHQRVSISIHYPTQLPCAPHKLVHAHDTQLRQHHTHSSFCKVMLPARASARRCAPVASMLFREKLRGWREHRDRSSIITIKITELLSKTPYRSSVSVGSLRLRRSMASSRLSDRILLQQSTKKTRISESDS